MPQGEESVCLSREKPPVIAAEFCVLSSGGAGGFEERF